jgi:hypothetical protein
VEDFRRWSARQKGSRRTMCNGMDELDLCSTARAGSGFAPTNYCSGGISCARLSHTSLIQNLLQSITQNQHLRSIGVSRANISSPSYSKMSYSFVTSSAGSSITSIPLPRLRAGICISSRDVIARRLLQSIGLRLRALRIELFAKLALAAL